VILLRSSQQKILIRELRNFLMLSTNETITQHLTKSRLPLQNKHDRFQAREAIIKQWQSFLKMKREQVSNNISKLKSS